MSLLARKLSKFLSKTKRNKGKGFARQRGTSKDYEKSNDEIICYECKKLDHICQDCLLKKKKRQKGEEI